VSLAWRSGWESAAVARDARGEVLTTRTTKRRGEDEDQYQWDVEVILGLRLSTVDMLLFLESWSRWPFKTAVPLRLVGP